MISSSSAMKCGNTSCSTVDRFTTLAALPGMAERTIKIGSAGKIFSLTGWKVGWMVAAPELASVVARAHQFLTFSTAPNLQSAVAYGLKRWRCLARADAAPLHACPRPNDRGASGRRLQSLRPSFDLLPVRRSCCIGRGAGRRELSPTAAVERAGVAVVPLSAFAENDPPRHLVRLCFGKKDETIDAGVAAMAKAKEMLA